MYSKYAVAWLVLLVLAYGSVRGELRVWTDEHGKTIEAEHVTTLSDQVVLRRADGTEVRVSLDTLSEKDRAYAVLKTPPRLDISVSPKQNRSNSRGAKGRPGSQVTDEAIIVAASIKKSSPSPYDATLRAELFVLGGAPNHDGYMILDVTTDEFNLSASSPHSFDSNEINLRQVEYREKRGVEYEGYLLVVRDANGDIISKKTSKLAFEKNAAAILEGKTGTVFDDEFGVVKQRAKPAPQKNPKKPLPGRRF